MKTSKLIFSTLLFVILCFATAQQACAQTAVRLTGFMKAETDTTFPTLKFSTIGCKAFGNAGEEAKIWFNVNSSIYGDTILIDAGDSYSFVIPQSARWGIISIEMHTLTPDSAGRAYVKCLGY